MSNYDPMKRPKVVEKLSELFQIAGIGSLFAGLGVFLGFLFLALAFVTCVKADRIEYDSL